MAWHVSLVASSASDVASGSVPSCSHVALLAIRDHVYMYRL